MTAIHPPTVVTSERVWPADEIEDLARWWRSRALADLADRTAPVALAMANHPLAVAAFFAALTLPAPIVLLARDPRSWRTSPPLPPGTTLVLLPGQSALAAEGASLGLDVRVLPQTTHPRDRRVDLVFVRAAGIVMFTSGSTGAPKPVFRSMAAAIDSARHRIREQRLDANAHVIASLPLDRAAAVAQSLLVPALTGARVALVDHVDYRGLLRLFAAGGYAQWTGTPAVADVLSRAVRARHPAPDVCYSVGRVSQRLFDMFLDRFGTPLRGYYGSTEAPWIAVDTRPREDVRPGCVGPPSTAVDVAIGARPDTPVDPGEIGRIWVRSPWLMEGYGFPPDLEPPTVVGGFWGTPDVGRLEADGALAVIGRIDDTVRTGTGQLVNLGVVVNALLGAGGVRDAVVVPIESSGGTVIGALVEVDDVVAAAALRAHLAASVPMFFMPRIVETTSALPRLADGRADRLSCIARLRAAL